MAEVLASLKKIGGNGEQYTETVLWTNPSPTADFAAQTITLSDSISKYKYIGIKYCYAKTNTDIVDTAIYKTEEVRTSVIDGSHIHNIILLGVENANNYGFARIVGYVSDTSIKFTIAYRLNVASTLTNAVIPLEILGINELAHGKIQTDYGLLPYSTSETTKITLGYKPSFVEIKRYKDSTHWAVDTYDANLSSVKQLVGALNGSTKVALEDSVPTTTQNMIASIDDDGFTVTAFQSAAITTYGVPYYRAIGS